jgi:hypothetical protein
VERSERESKEAIEIAQVREFGRKITICSSGAVWAVVIDVERKDHALV